MIRIISSRCLICRKCEQKLNCLDFGRHEVVARCNVEWQPSAQTDKDVSQDDDP